MIYTSYFSNLKHIPKNYVPISISRFPPSWYHGLSYKKIAPSAELLTMWKGGCTESEYVAFYEANVLDTLDSTDVINDLYRLSGVLVDPDKEHIVLLCFEKPNDFCHRHLVAKWLNNSGYNVKELT